MDNSILPLLLERPATPGKLKYRRLIGRNLLAAYHINLYALSAEKYFDSKEPVILDPLLPIKDKDQLKMSFWGAGTKKGLVGIMIACENAIEPTNVEFGSLYVSPAFRKEGVARNIYESAYHWAQKKNFLSVQFSVCNKNEPMIKFCENLGFSAYAETTDELTWGDGSKARCIFYRKELEPKVR